MRKSILIPNVSLAEGIAKIKQGLVEKPKPPAKPTLLKVRDIYTMVSVFQHRALDGRMADDEAHIDALVDAIGKPEKPRALDPCTVWWGGSLGWMLVDGYHRIEAHRRLKLGHLPIPVTVFEGTLAEAMAQAAALNSKDRLPMLKEEKTQAAWKLVLTSDLSKARIADATKVSERTVANMRVKVREIDGRIDPFTLADMAWKTVNRLSVDELLGGAAKPSVVEDWEEKNRRIGEQWAKRIEKTLGSNPMKNPQAMAIALDILDKRLPPRLIEAEAWEEHLQSLLDDRGFEDGGYD